MRYRISEANCGLLFYVLEKHPVSGLSPFGSVYVGMGWNQFMRRCGQRVATRTFL